MDINTEFQATACVLHINYVNISNLQRGWGADKSCNPGPKVINPDCKVILSYFLCPHD